MREANLKAYDRLTLIRPASILGGSDDDFKRASDDPIRVINKISVGPLNVSFEQIPGSKRGEFSDLQPPETVRSALDKAQVPYSARSYISDI